jgi:hypothetical protein
MQQQRRLGGCPGRGGLEGQEPLKAEKASAARADAAPGGQNPKEERKQIEKSEKK